MWQDNALRWDRSGRSHYEAWYLTFYDPRGGRAFWIRYTILAPAGDPARGEAGVWFFAFEADTPDRQVATKRIRPLAELAVEADPLAFRLGDGSLRAGALTGSLDSARGRVAWDLRFDASQPTYHHLHGLLRALKVSKATVCAPALDTRFSGEVRIGDEVVKVVDWPGQQSHVWGLRYSPGWIWAHANAFPGGAAAVFEGVSSRIPLGAGTSPPLTTLFLRADGRTHAWRAPRHLLRTASALWLPGRGQYRGVPVGAEGLGRPEAPAGDPGAGPAAHPEAAGEVAWIARATGFAEALSVCISARPRDLVGIEHLGPTGEPRFCYNSEVASADVRLERRTWPGAAWRPAGAWRAERSASLEVVLSTPLAEYPIHLKHAV